MYSPSVPGLSPHSPLAKLSPTARNVSVPALFVVLFAAAAFGALLFALVSVANGIDEDVFDSGDRTGSMSGTSPREERRDRTEHQIEEVVEAASAEVAVLWAAVVATTVAACMLGRWLSLAYRSLAWPDRRFHCRDAYRPAWAMGFALALYGVVALLHAGPWSDEPVGTFLIALLAVWTNIAVMIVALLRVAAMIGDVTFAHAANHRASSVAMRLSLLATMGLWLVVTVALLAVWRGADLDGSVGGVFLVSQIGLVSSAVCFGVSFVLGVTVATLGLASTLRAAAVQLGQMELDGELQMVDRAY